MVMTTEETAHTTRLQQHQKELYQSVSQLEVSECMKKRIDEIIKKEGKINKWMITAKGSTGGQARTKLQEQTHHDVIFKIIMKAIYGEQFFKKIETSM